MQRRSKYNARKTEVDGFVFDSIKEANRYQELKLLELAGEITDLQLQPEFVLQKGFHDNKGKIHRPIIYRADFWYRENGKIIVEDVKGMKTQVYQIKKKLFIYSRPQIDFREV